MTASDKGEHEGGWGGELEAGVMSSTVKHETAVAAGCTCSVVHFCSA